MKQPDWYAAWRHEAVHELIAKGETLRQAYGLGEHERYNYDIDTGLITFSNRGMAAVVARIQIVGTTSARDGNWLWAWANDWWPKTVITAAEATRQFGAEKKIEELTTEYLYEDSIADLGWEMTAITARITEAIGAYRAPTQNGHLFLVYTEIDFAQ
jgi:hypothetical protein